MKSIIYLLLAFLHVSCSQTLFNQDYNYVPPQGYVPNEETAIKIAEAIWLPVYGNKIYERVPFVAKLNNGVWIVSGTVKEDYGGAPYIEIRAKDCKVMRMFHGK